MEVLENPGIQLILERLKAEKGIKKTFFITCFGSILGAFVPLIYGKVIRLAGNDISPIWYMAAFIFMWATLDQIRNWTTRYSDKMGRYTAWDVGSKLFLDGIFHLIRLPMNFLSEQRLGKVVQRLERGSDRIERTIAEVLFSLIPHFLSLMFAIVLMFFIKWQLALMVLLVIILYTLSMTSSNKRLLELSREVKRTWEEAWGHLWDVVRNVKAVKSNTNEDFEIDRISGNFNKCYSKEKDIENIRDKIRTLEHLAFGLGSVSVISTGALMLRWGTLDAGDLFSFFGYITLAYSPFSRLAHNWRLIQETMVNEERVAHFLALEEEDYQSGEDIEISGDIEFRNVSFGYADGNPILQNISFTVQKGQTVAIVGESGGGKTTLVDLLSRYYETTAGDILIGGRSIKEWKLGSLRSQIGVVPQDIDLFNERIRLNIAYGQIEHLENDEVLQEAARISYAHDFIADEKFVDGYDQVVGERGVKLSAGQRQRVAIARAIIRDPRILILDEATSALDSESEMYVQKALQVLIQSRTTIIIAHRLSTIKKADKIVVLQDGKIGEIGTHHELLAIQNGIYRKFIELQSFQE
ncbi:MAG: ABC transporter ATP-binding protein [Candidatus Paceibacterota bacterium]